MILLRHTYTTKNGRFIQKKSTHKRNNARMTSFVVLVFLKEQKFFSLREKQSQIEDKKKLYEKFCPRRLHSFLRLVKGTLSKYSTIVNSTCSASSALFNEVWRDQLFATIRAAVNSFAPEFCLSQHNFEGKGGKNEYRDTC